MPVNSQHYSYQSSAILRQDYCENHSDKIATSKCSRCGKLLCLSCVERVDVGSRDTHITDLCSDCAESRNYCKLISVFVFIVVLIVGFCLVLAGGGLAVFYK